MSESILPLPRFIAVTGQEGSGKDSYGEHLAQLGYMHVSAGDVIRARARTQGHTDPIPRRVLSQIGDQMKKDYGPSPITTSTIAEYFKMQTSFPAGLVISGLRRVGELAAFKQQGAITLWIEASTQQRFANQIMRDRDDRQDFTAFEERGQQEYYGSTDGGSDGVNLQAIEAMADCRVQNNASLEALFYNGDAVLRASNKQAGLNS